MDSQIGDLDAGPWPTALIAPAIRALLIAVTASSNLPGNFPAISQSPFARPLKHGIRLIRTQ